MKTRSNFKRQTLLGAAFLALMLLTARSACAVIFASSGDPAFNTAGPTGELANSGWEFQGHWNGFLGTPVSPRHFVSAKHIGGAIGGSFFFQGATYLTVGVTNNGTDLNVWEIAGRFPTYAPLFQGSNPAGQPVVIFGRGTRRGNEVVLEGQVKGWAWGAADGVLRWGENVVAGKYGSLLKFNFDRLAGPNEAHLSSGDSGGGIFVNDNGTWKLAAINYAVEGPWKLSGASASFQAAMVDKGGLYRGTTYYLDTDADSPSAFYATPIAPHFEWLRGVLNLPPVPPEHLRVTIADEPVSQPGSADSDASSITLGTFAKEKGPAPGQPVILELTGGVRTGP